MNHKRLWIVAALIACLILASFLVSFLRAKEATRPSTAVPALTGTTTPAVSFKDTYRRGTHTLSGTVTAPDACVTPEVNATLQGDASSTQSILLSISLPEDTGVCLQIPTEVPFSTTLNAPSGLPITVAVNGVIATTTP